MAEAVRPRQKRKAKKQKAKTTPGTAELKDDRPGVVDLDLSRNKGLEEDTRQIQSHPIDDRTEAQSEQDETVKLPEAQDTEAQSEQDETVKLLEAQDTEAQSKQDETVKLLEAQDTEAQSEQDETVKLPEAQDDNFETETTNFTEHTKDQAETSTQVENAATGGLQEHTVVEVNGVGLKDGSQRPEAASESVGDAYETQEYSVRETEKESITNDIREGQGLPKADEELAKNDVSYPEQVQGSQIVAQQTENEQQPEELNQSVQQDITSVPVEAEGASVLTFPSSNEILKQASGMTIAEGDTAETQVIQQSPDGLHAEDAAEALPALPLSSQNIRQMQGITSVPENVKTYVTEQNRAPEIRTALPVISQQASVQERIAAPLEIQPSIYSPLKQFSEEQLKMFYFNPELEQVSMFIDEFLKNANREKHEFYDLVYSYYRARILLVKTQKEIKQFQNEAKEHGKTIWKLKHCKVTAEGYCKDGIKLMRDHSYEIMEWNGDGAINLNKSLKDLRDSVHESFQLKAYNSQVAKIRIESYIHDLFMSSPLLRNVTTEDPISGLLPSLLKPDNIPSLCKLQDCITVLFAFKRLGETEKEFMQDLDSWLERMVSALQRVGALPDHFFIFNHILRCPPTTIAPINHFVQFPSFLHVDQSGASPYDCPLVHHVVVMLATLALPVRQRKEFLSKYKANIQPSTERSISWLLVDEDREESAVICRPESCSQDGLTKTRLDENPEDSWSLLHENDLVALFEQFPFEALFKYLLKIQIVEGSMKHSSMTSTSNDMMRLFAFGSCMVKLLGQIFETYNLLRYRQFVKRISRTIRLVVQVVSDHWCSYRTWRIEICGDSDKDIPKFMTVAQQYNLERLQLEFDMFFMRATNQILSSHSVGALQFLASMPYDAVSTNAAWSLLNHLTHLREQANEGSSEIGDISPGEAVFLLTALSNMANSRPSEDRSFIQHATEQILEISYANEATRDFCERNGRDLLVSISSTHPFVISSLLFKVGDLVEYLQKNCLYIFNALPIGLWKPEPRDMEKIRTWLLEFPITSVNHQLARTVLSKLNFGADPETEKLFLPTHFHCAVAVMLVEVYGACFPDGPGGLKSLEYQDGGIISQVSKLAVSSYNKIVYAQAHEEFEKWSWDTMLSLKLHETDISVTEDQGDSELLLTFEQSQKQENGNCGSWFGKTLLAFSSKKSKALEVQHCPELLNVQRAAQSQGALACYVCLAMTTIGHDPTAFLCDGLGTVFTIVDSGWIDGVLRIVSNIIPLYLPLMGPLVENSEFSRLIDILVHTDANRAGYTEKIWQYPEPGLYSQKLASIISNHVITMSKKSREDSYAIITIWFQSLIRLANWYRDYTVQYLLDHLCKAAYTVDGGFQVIVSLLHDQFMNLIQLQVPRGILSSVMSWISSSAPITLLEIKSYPDYSYFAYAVLQMETQYEEKCGLWRELTTELMMHPKYTVEVAYKKACSCVKASYLPPLSNLSLYRCAEQAMVTNMDHPLLPLLWQQYFLLFLQKPDKDTGLPDRSGVGYKFFDSHSYSSMAKKMKSYLYSLANYHREKSKPNDENESDNRMNALEKKTHILDETIHSNLASLYQTMGLWIEEPRLHDPNLFLEALPEIYRPELLASVFRGEKALWQQFVDTKCIEQELESITSLWTASVNKPSSNRRSTESQLRPTASQRIIIRLSKEDKPKPPPSVQQSTSPVPEVTLQLLLTRPKLVQEINHDLERVVQFAKRSSTQLATNVALDEEYLELLSDLYEHISRQFVVAMPCDGRKGKKGRCTGSAQVVLTYQEKNLRDRNARAIGENRTEWEALLSSCAQGLVHNLCTGAVYVENVISQILKSFQYANESQRLDLHAAGVRLFYLLAELIDADVKRCPPAIQFFSSCIEVLGKKFIAENEDEQLPLLEIILNNDATVSFLAPHFNPTISQSTAFLKLYTRPTDVFEEGKVTTTFVLLTKFDIRNWLATSSSLSDRHSLVRIIVTAISKLGRKPSEESRMALDVYRGHLLNVLSYRFPEQYGETLRFVIEGCSKGVVVPDVLLDFMVCIGCCMDDHHLPVSVDLWSLQSNEAHETLIWMTKFFREALLVHRSSVEVLYSKWQPYIRYVAKFMSFLFSKLVSTDVMSSLNSLSNKEKYLSEIWSQIVAVYRPWITSSVSDVSWPTSHLEEATAMIQSFVESVRSLADSISVEVPFISILNLVWGFYCSEIAARNNDEQHLSVYHAMLSTLPWMSFCPAIQDLERMLQLQGECPPAFHFLGTILCLMNWSGIVHNYSNLGSMQLLGGLLSSLLKLFAILSVDKDFIAKTRSKFEDLNRVAVGFPWQCLDVPNVQFVCEWFSENCDPATVVDESSYTTCALVLLKSACGFKLPPHEVHYKLFSSKRHCYVKAFVKLLTRVASSKKIKSPHLNTAVTALLRDIESVETLNTQDAKNELLVLCPTVLSLLNCIPEGIVLDEIEKCIHNYMSETNCVLLVLSVLSSASRAIASLNHLVALMEKCIESHFIRQSDGDLKHAWNQITEVLVVPDLNREEFIRKALVQQCLLTLYACNYQKLSLAKSQSDELTVLVDIVQWCSQIPPTSNCQEKFLLLWWQIFDIVRRLVGRYNSNSQYQQLARYMLYLAHACQQIGEDKTYSGLLGVIGIGKKSPFATSFRLAARSINAYILAQMPASGVALRCSPDAPGSVKGSSGPGRPTPEAEKALKELENNLKNKQYGAMKVQIRWIVDFIVNPRNSIVNGNELLSYVCKEFFYKTNFVVATVS